MKKMIESKRWVIRLLGKKDAAKLQQYYSKNKAFFKPWMPTYAPNRFQLEYVEASIVVSLDHYQKGVLLPFIVLHPITDELIGTITYSQIQRGVAQYCCVGYNISETWNGMGVATEALEATNRYVFEVLNLHRIEANILPVNKGSIRVVEKLGFEKEGICKALLKIDGHWQDHIRYALINPLVE
ncbi:GNAT family N-acetyltransferase [Aureispira sp. CCB-E]|uniref:GNAT family N-acetyltransferase n=1 Tax=Aureispira sp. CCB-E TaxID=3051121 RepID=UPI00286845DF|nr:GNAT family N-acetyltransferase [Aureispira sp. CCB-E]WMX14421.1 GNAT family N-acetyltransferase [Aureispira sp. CCB-E]